MTLLLSSAHILMEGLLWMASTSDEKEDVSATGQSSSSSYLRSTARFVLCYVLLCLPSALTCVWLSAEDFSPSETEDSIAAAVRDGTVLSGGLVSLAVGKWVNLYCDYI
jgi:hypothetical protein